MSDLTRRVIEHQTYRTGSDVVSTTPTGHCFQLTYSSVINLVRPALGVSAKSVHLVAGRLGFYSQSGHTKDFKNSIRSFRARRSAQAEVRRVLCMCCSSCYVP